jgi:hypothetical protein
VPHQVSGLLLQLVPLLPRNAIGVDKHRGQRQGLLVPDAAVAVAVTAKSLGCGLPTQHVMVGCTRQQQSVNSNAPGREGLTMLRQDHDAVI